MKIDKDALIKHRFWIIVGLSVPLALIAIILLATSVSNAIASVRTKLQKVETDLKNAQKDPKTPDDIERKKIEASKLIEEETKAWKKAFKDQETLARWPRKMEETYHFADGWFASEVKVIKAPENKADWPADKEGELHHGTVRSGDNEQFTILDRDGKTRTFYVTPRLIEEKAKSEDGDAKEIPIGKLSTDAKDKLVAVVYQKGRYFNDRLTKAEIDLYKKTYHSQIPPILRVVDPLRIEKGEDDKPFVAGVVQLRSSSNWMFNQSADQNYKEIPEDKKKELLPPEGSKFLRYLATDWKATSDISDEAWIAQEDLWIQTEIYRLIRAANDSVAEFKNVMPKDAKAGSPVRYQNPYLDLTLNLKDGKTLELKLANRLSRRLKIDMLKLRIRFLDDAKAEPEVITIKGDPLDPTPSAGSTRDVSINLKPGPRRDGIFGVEQVLTWETAAVKRIDHIAIGSMAGDDMAFAHRTMPEGLQPLVKVEKKDDSSGSPTGGGPGIGGGPPSGGPSSSGAKSGSAAPPGGGYGGGKAGESTILANGFAVERYQEVTPQFRRIPIAIALIVDQSHVDRVQNAFNNSKLRFLMTQVILNHYPQSLRPQIPGEKSESAQSGISSGYAPPPPPVGGGSGLVPGSGFKKGSYADPNKNGSSAPAQELEANMELVLYGIVTVYQRPGAAAAGAAPAAPTAPPGAPPEK
jgi:hypothetical protein